MKKSRIYYFISLLLVLMFSVMLVTYAWFVTVWNSGRSFLGFSTGQVPPPSATMWLYSTQFEETDEQKLGWIEHSLTDNPQDPHAFLIPEVQSNVTEETYNFELKSLQLGTVDNLVVMNQDNIIYLRFDFDSEVQGNSVARIMANLGNDFGLVYDSEGVDVTESVKNNLQQLNSQTPFLCYQACFSEKKISPNEQDFETLSFSETMLFGTESDLYADAQQRIEGEYSIYIKITPNLSAFAPASELLNKHMPCVILFDTQIQLTVY